MNKFTITDRIDIKRTARDKLKGNLLMPFLATLIIGAVIGALSSGFYIKTENGSVISGGASSILELLVMGFVGFGAASYFLKFVREGKTDLDSLFDGTSSPKACILSNILISLIVALGCILLIVPGIIFALNYSMTYYILVDNPGMSAQDAMKKSKEMMKGYRLDYFMLGLSFILWYLGIVLTLGILAFYVMPYMQTTYALFYDRIKSADEKAPEEGTVSADDLEAFKNDATASDPIDMDEAESNDADADFFGPANGGEENKKDDEIFF